MNKFIFAFISILTVFFIFKMNTIENEKINEKPIITIEDWGVVSKIICGSFMQPKCKVITNKIILNNIKLKKFPSGVLYVGDHIRLKKLTYKNSVEKHIVKNNESIYYSGCSGWKSCFDK
jgi:hypothetical protein